MNILLFLAVFAASTEVTVYNEDLGLIKEVRPLALKAGVQELSVVDVAARIDPTSVHFKSLTAPNDVSVLEQNFQYDLISQEKLLEKYLGKEIELERILGSDGRKERVKGTLMSTQGGLILKSEGRLLVNPGGSPILPELPEGLLTKPTLVWKLDSAKAGAHQAELSYMTAGMSWQADYILLANADDTRMDLNSWVTLNNASGATYKDAKLKLVAGDVNRAQDDAAPMMKRAYALAEAAPAPRFEERQFFEYHLYALSRPTTLRDNEQKQLELASAAGVPLKKLFIYDGARTGKKVEVKLEFKNSKDQNLGMPLPKGRIRVYKKDTDGSLIFAGEDNIDHTPKDETVRVKVGDAFDVVGERKRMDVQLKSARERAQETFEIKLRNHKDQDVTVTVVERLMGTTWKIEDATAKWTKKDSNTVEFQVPVKKDAEAVVSYTVKYSW